MDQAELELKIDVWKKLALSKQMLIKTATDSLGLDPECSMDEFKSKLDEAIAKGNSAEADIAWQEAGIFHRGNPRDHRHVQGAVPDGGR